MGSLDCKHIIHANELSIRTKGEKIRQREGRDSGEGERGRDGEKEDREIWRERKRGEGERGEGERREGEGEIERVGES